MSTIHYTNEREARAFLASIIEPGNAALGQLVGLVGAKRAASILVEGDVGRDPELHDLARTVRQRVSAKPFIEQYQEWVADGYFYGIPTDTDYPEGLADLGSRAPLGLWRRGRSRSLNGAVAIVGARAATAYGQRVAEDLATGLADKGTPVISGLAYGIDGAAHRAAIAAGGITAAFVAGGLSRAYPAGHQQLFERIVEYGTAYAEISPDATPTRWRFLRRNALIAAASAATVVVEAGMRSGSLNTATHAQELGRRLGAVPGPITSAASVGCHELLRHGATPITNIADVRGLLGL